MAKFESPSHFMDQLMVEYWSKFKKRLKSPANVVQSGWQNRAPLKQITFGKLNLSLFFYYKHNITLWTEQTNKKKTLN